MSAALRRNDSRRLLLFTVTALSVVAIWLWLLRGTFYREHPAIAETGAAIDLMITIPLLFWLVMGRSRTAASRKEMATVAALGLAVTLLIVPGAASAATNLIWIFELALIGSVVWRLRAAVTRSERDQPLERRIRQVTRDLIPFGPAADAAASEIALIAYAFAPRRLIEIDRRRFRWKGTDDWNGVVVGLGVIIVAETIGVHLWLHESHPVIAWVILALDLYGILWLAGDSRALGVSAATIEDGELVIDFGLRWRGRIPIERIDSVDSYDEGHDVDLKLALIEEPEVVVVLSEPVTFQAVYGFRKRVRRVALRLENWSELAAQLGGPGGME